MYVPDTHGFARAYKLLHLSFLLRLNAYVVCYSTRADVRRDSNIEERAEAGGRSPAHELTSLVQLGVCSAQNLALATRSAKSFCLCE